jgi:hypothetical protein
MCKFFVKVSIRVGDLNWNAYEEQCTVIEYYISTLRVHSRLSPSAVLRKVYVRSSNMILISNCYCKINGTAEPLHFPKKTPSLKSALKAR